MGRGVPARPRQNLRMRLQNCIIAVQKTRQCALQQAQGFAPIADLLQTTVTQRLNTVFCFYYEAVRYLAAYAGFQYHARRQQ